MNSTRYIFHIIFLLLIPFLAKGTPDSSEIEKSLQRFAHFVKQNESSTKKNHYFKYQSIELDNATHMAKEYVNGGTSMLNVNDQVYSQITQELSTYNQALGGAKSVYVFHGRYFLSYEARFYKEENKSSYDQFKSTILEKLGMIEGISVVPYDNIPQSKRQAFVEALESYHKENKKGKLNKKKTTQDLVRRLGDLLKSQNLQAKKIIVVFLLEEYVGDMTEKEGVKGLDKIDVAINIKGNLWSQYLDLEQGFGIVPDIYGFLNSQERNADEFNITLPEAGSNQTEGYGKALLAMVKRLLRVEANLKAMQKDFFDYLKERAALEKRLKEYITANNKLNKDQKNQTYIEDKSIIASIIEKLKKLPVGNTGAIVIENAGTGRYEVVKNGGGLPEVIELTEKEKALLGKLYGKGGTSLEQLVEWLDFADDTIEKQLDSSCKFCPPEKNLLSDACKKMQEIIDKAGKDDAVYIKAIKKLCAENAKWGELVNAYGGGWHLMDEVHSMEKNVLQVFLKEVIGTKNDSDDALSKNIKTLQDKDIIAFKNLYTITKIEDRLYVMNVISTWENSYKESFYNDLSNGLADKINNPIEKPLYTRYERISFEVMDWLKRNFFPDGPKWSIYAQNIDRMNFFKSWRYVLSMDKNSGHINISLGSRESDLKAYARNLSSTSFYDFYARGFITSDKILTLEDPKEWMPLVAQTIKKSYIHQGKIYFHLDELSDFRALYDRNNPFFKKGSMTELRYLIDNGLVDKGKVEFRIGYNALTGTSLNDLQQAILLHKQNVIQLPIDQYGSFKDAFGISYE